MVSMGRFLRIGIVRDGQLLEERYLPMGVDVTIGKAQGNTFVVPQGNLRKSSLAFKARGSDRHALVFTTPDGRVDFGEQQVSTLAELVKSGLATRRETFYALPLPATARGKFQVGDVSIVFEYRERDLALSPKLGGGATTSQHKSSGPRPLVMEAELSWEGTVLATKFIDSLRPLTLGPGPLCDLQLPGRVLESRAFALIGGGEGRFFVDLRNPHLSVSGLETPDAKAAADVPQERYPIKGAFTMNLALREGFTVELRYTQAMARGSSSPFDIQDPLPFLSLAGSVLFHAALMLIAFAIGQSLLDPHEAKAVKAERRRELQVMLQEQKVEAKQAEEKKAANKKAEDPKEEKPKEEAKKQETKPEPKAAPKAASVDAGAASPEARRTKVKEDVRQKTFLSALGGTGEAGDGALPVGRETQYADAFDDVAGEYAANGAETDGMAPPGPKSGGENGAEYKTLSKSEKGGDGIETTTVKTSEKGAGEEAAIKVNVRTGSLGSEGGLGKIDNGAVAAVFGRRKGAIKACYEKELRRNPSLNGRITLRFTIGTSGRITSINASQNTTGDEAIASCIISKVQDWKFDPPTGGAVTFTYPFILEAR